MNKNLILIFGIFAVWLIMIRGLNGSMKNAEYGGEISEDVEEDEEYVDEGFSWAGGNVSDSVNDAVNGAVDKVNSEITPMTNVLNGLEKQYTL